MQYRQKIKSWIDRSVWVNPYWHKISEHPGRIFLEQDLLSDLGNLKLNLAKFNSLICEFGSGSGEHLIELARRNPNTAIVGFELRFKRIVKTIEKAKRAGLDNAFVICGYAQNAKEILEVGSVKEIFINFPDPWEKRTKHRLINENFLQDIYGILIDDGRVSFKTDHVEYYQSTKQLLKGSIKFKLDFCTEDLYLNLPKEEIIPTEFERLFLSQNIKISALSFLKGAL